MDETSCIFAIIAQLQRNPLMGFGLRVFFFSNKFCYIKNIVNVSKKKGGKLNNLDEKNDIFQTNPNFFHRKTQKNCGKSTKG